MTLHEIEEVLKHIEANRALASLQWERMLTLSMEAQGFSDKEIAVALSRSKEEVNRKNAYVMSVLRRAFTYDPVRASQIQRDWAAIDERTCEINKPLRQLCA